MRNLEKIREVYEAFAKGDVPGVLGILSDDVEWTEAEGFPLGGTYVGPNAVLENVFMPLATEWEGFSVVPYDFVDGGNTIVALGKYGGKYGATGKSLETHFAHVWKIRDGKV